MKQLKLTSWTVFKRTMVYYTGIHKILRLFIKPYKAYDKITDISMEEIRELKKEFHIKGLILDMDGTIKHYKRGVSEENIEWERQVKEELKVCLISNAGKGFVTEVAGLLDLDYVSTAKKPFKKGFTKAVNLLGIEKGSILAIGDALVADVVGSKRYGIGKVILVDDMNK